MMAMVWTEKGARNSSVSYNKHLVQQRVYSCTKTSWQLNTFPRTGDVRVGRGGDRFLECGLVARVCPSKRISEGAAVPLMPFRICLVLRPRSSFFLRWFFFHAFFCSQPPLQLSWS